MSDRTPYFFLQFFKRNFILDIFCWHLIDSNSCPGLKLIYIITTYNVFGYTIHIINNLNSKKLLHSISITMCFSQFQITISSPIIIIKFNTLNTRSFKLTNLVNLCFWFWAAPPYPNIPRKKTKPKSKVLYNRYIYTNIQ